MTTEPDRLLVVDDNKVNRMLLVRHLEEQGHCVTAVVIMVTAVDEIESAIRCIEVGAALFMTLFRSLLRFTIEVTHTFGQRSPKSKLKYAASLTNDYIANTYGDTGMFSTIFFGLLDPANGMLTYLNAGHENLLVVNSDGAYTSLKKTDPAVGAIADAEFAVQEVQLHPGEMFFAFTDGAPDALDPEGNPFGKERLVSLLHSDIAASKLPADINAKLDEHVGEAERFDDITFFHLIISIGYVQCGIYHVYGYKFRPRLYTH